MNTIFFKELAEFAINHPYWMGLVFIVLSILIVYKIIPSLILVSKLKNLTAKVNSRTSHSGSVPNLGGVAVFIAYFIVVNLAAMLVAKNDEFIMLVVFNICLLLFVVIGVIDDIIGVNYRTKLLFYFFLSLSFVFLTDIRIPSFFGLLFIETLPLWASVLFSAFVLVIMVNAINLIDGIDGLASMQVLLTSAILIIVFFESGYVLSGFSNSSILGTLLAFIFFNFSGKNKIFLGDTGSILIGFLMGFNILLIFRFQSESELYLTGSNPHLLALALCGYPLLDVLRVFVLRTWHGMSPFKPDKRHLHHFFVKQGLSHIATSTLLFFYTICLVMCAYLLRYAPPNLGTIILIIWGILLMGLLQWLIHYYKQRKRNVV